VAVRILLEGSGGYRFAAEKSEGHNSIVWAVGGLCL
jgi:hypothetical protein